MSKARELIEDLPAVHAALLAGQIDMPKALVIAELVGWLPADQLATRRQLVERVIDRAAEWTTGQLRAKLRKLILAIAPEAVKARYRSAVKARRVEWFDNPDGTGELWGRSLPPQDAAAAWERLTAIARAAKAAGDSRSVQQLRVDAFLDLLIGEGVAVGQPLTHRTGGLPDPDTHQPDADRPATAVGAMEPSPAVEQVPSPAGAQEPLPIAAEPAGACEPAAAPAAAAEPAANPEAEPGVEAEAGSESVEWDPAWPSQPWEPIGPHDVHPDPTGPQPIGTTWRGTTLTGRMSGRLTGPATGRQIPPWPLPGTSQPHPRQYRRPGVASSSSKYH
ncbi:MAG TPA: DUF222 domain-containing protein [Natronosporangium sp.]